jgi:hypothetical protein
MGSKGELKYMAPWEGVGLPTLHSDVKVIWLRKESEVTNNIMRSFRRQ